MIELIYKSQANYGFDKPMIEDLLTQARESNAQNDITGMLFFDGEYFVQLLEGPLEKIEPLYDVICNDKRHSDIKQIYSGGIRRRSFNEWHMGYEFVSPLTGEKLEYASAQCELELQEQSVDHSRGITFFKYLKDGNTETL